MNNAVNLLFFVAACMYGCENISNEDYFGEEKLSPIQPIDDGSKAYFTKELRYMNEPSLRILKKEVTRSVRLLIHPAFWSSHTVRLEELDSTYHVIVKLGRDKSAVTKSGLSTLSLEYTSEHEMLDSLTKSIFKQLSELDFDSVKHGEFADGITYVLEMNYNGTYKVLVVHEGSAQKNIELANIIKAIRSLVPRNLLPTPNPLSPKSALFSVIQRDSS